MLFLFVLFSTLVFHMLGIVGFVFTWLILRFWFWVLGVLLVILIRLWEFMINVGGLIYSWLVIILGRQLIWLRFCKLIQLVLFIHGLAVVFIVLLLANWVGLYVPKFVWIFDPKHFLLYGLMMILSWHP